MALKTKIKVTNITSLSEARYCAGMGVDFLGFSINDPEKDIKLFTEISSWVAGPAFVLEFNDTLLLNQISSDQLANEFVQINANALTTVDPGKVLNPLFVLIDENLDEQTRQSLINNKNIISYIITSVDVLKKYESLLKDFNVLITEPQLDTNLDSLLALNINGFALSGSKESKPGIQDYSYLASILEQLEINED